MSTNNSIAIHLKMQEFASISPMPINEILADPAHFFTNLGKSHKKVLNYIARLSSIHSRCYPTHDTISRCGKGRDQLISVPHVKRVINDLVSWGLMAKGWRGVKVSNVYKLSKFFNNDAVRYALSSVEGMDSFKNFKWLSKKLIVSARILLVPLIEKARQLEYDLQQLRDKVSLKNRGTFSDSKTVSKILKLSKTVLKDSICTVGCTTRARTCIRACVSVHTPATVKQGFSKKES